VYRKLQSLQGDHIPLLYGEVMVDDGEQEVPALLLEHIYGTTLNRLSPEHLESIEARKIIDGGNDPNNELSAEQILNPRLVKALRNVFDELERKGVVHGDPRADNFIATRRKDGSYKVVAVDFEFPHVPSDETNAMGLLSVIYELSDIVAPDVFGGM
jgi:tRNA A-37 threonylcarbamoyl transferase component Bud32